MQTIINFVGNKNISIKNFLKTSITVVDASEKKFVAPSSTESVFAAWSKSLNRQPKTDLFEPQKHLNHPKDETQNFYTEIEKSRKHRKWLNEIDQNMAWLKRKRYKV